MPDDAENFGDLGGNFGGFSFDFEAETFCQNLSESINTSIQRTTRVQQILDAEFSDTTPDVLREQSLTGENSQQQAPEISLLEDIGNILRNQKKPRKRRNSSSADISQRLGSKEPKLTEETQIDANNNENVIPLEQGTYVEQEEENEVLNSTLTVQDLQKPGVPFIPFDEPVIPSPIAKPKSNKRKMIVDKSIKLNEEVLRKNMRNYVLQMTVTPPMSEFEERLQQIKIENLNLFVVPGTKLSISPVELLNIFKRNLKVIPKSLLKRKREEEEIQQESSPPKLRRRKENSSREMNRTGTELVQAMAEVLDFEITNPFSPETCDFACPQVEGQNRDCSVNVKLRRCSQYDQR